MSKIEIDKSLVLSGIEFTQPRWLVEKDKLLLKYPQFKFLGTENTISSIIGIITTRQGNYYQIKARIPRNYPYKIPEVILLSENIQLECPRAYQKNRIYIMNPSNWSSGLSLAFVIRKAEVWLNKYDFWKKNGGIKWPGLRNNITS